jgi:tRNA 2-thiouridine synthesizing protein A
VILVLSDNYDLKSDKIHKLDISGKVCPLTFVYTKLALEKMNSGDILELTLDFPAAVKNVPDNCKRQNIGELLDIKRVDKEKKSWILKIKKI